MVDKQDMWAYRRGASASRNGQSVTQCMKALKAQGIDNRSEAARAAREGHNDMTKFMALKEIDEDFYR